MPSPSPQFVANLFRLAKEPSRELKLLLADWPTVYELMQNERRKTEESLPDDDPLRLDVDLLSPLYRARDEVIHTQALSFLLNPEAAHGFKKAALVAFLSELPRYGTGLGTALRLVMDDQSSITVDPEYRFGSFQEEVFGRCDVWVEVHSKRGSALVIIENKIDAPEGKRQLHRYETQAANWCKTHQGRRILVFLTAGARETKTSREGMWLSMPYLRLARALRRVWSDCDREKPASTWLALYIATLMKGVLGYSLEPKRYYAPSADMEAYLGR